MPGRPEAENSAWWNEPAKSGSIGRTKWDHATGSGASLPGWVALGRILDCSGPCCPYLFSGDSEMSYPTGSFEDLVE